MPDQDLGSLTQLLSSTSKSTKKSEKVAEALDENTEILHHIELKYVIEDAKQCRREFDENFLKELAADIKVKGVKQPIIVGSKDADGNYQLKAGAQRYRASKIAECERIPARIDDAFDKFDQVNENLKRKSLSTRDLCAFIKGCIDEGDSKGEIAKALQMSNSQISEAVAFGSLPRPVIERLYETGLVTEVGPLYLISTILKAKEGVQKGLLTEIEQRGGATVAYLKDYKKKIKEAAGGSSVETNATKIIEAKGTEQVANVDKESDLATVTNIVKKPDASKSEPFSIMRLVGKYEGSEVEIIPTRKPSKKGMAWAVLDGETVEVDLSKTELLFLKEQ